MQRLIIVSSFLLLVALLSGCGGASQVNKGIPGSPCSNGESLSTTSGCVVPQFENVAGEYAARTFYIKEGRKIYLSGGGDYIINDKGEIVFL